MATDNRKTFRLDDDVADLLQKRKEKGSYGRTENDVINAVVRNIPRQEAEIVRLTNKLSDEQEQTTQWKRKYEAKAQELDALTNALMLVGSYLNPLGK